MKTKNFFLSSEDRLARYDEEEEVSCLVCGDVDTMEGVMVRDGYGVRAFARPPAGWHVMPVIHEGYERGDARVDGFEALCSDKCLETFSQRQHAKFLLDRAKVAISPKFYDSADSVAVDMAMQVAREKKARVDAAITAEADAAVAQVYGPDWRERLGMPLKASS